MSLIQKEYFRLEEVVRDLELSGSDVIYLAENGHFRLSTLVYGVLIERGYIEDVGDGDWQSIPDSRDWWTGLLDLWERDAHQILKTGSAEVSSFYAPDGRYCHSSPSAPAVRITPHDLLVRRSERQRLEGLLGQQFGTLLPQQQQTATSFTHEPDYRIVQLGGEIYSLGPYQAGVVRILHQAALAGRPWCKGVDILAEIECSTLRMSDLFKSKRGWRKLIDSNARGMYRLAVSAQR